MFPIHLVACKVHTHTCTNRTSFQVQLRTSLEKTKIQEETIEQLRQDIHSQSNASKLQHELKDLEKLYTDG